jgi:uncharacterized membrane protein YeaQ/YmgE (transglycosylase-associated protein family)
MTNFVWMLIIGAVAGWLAGKLTQGRGFGLIANVVIGVLGAVLGGILFRVVGLSAVGTIGEIITATVGAIVLLFVLRKLKR